MKRIPATLSAKVVLPLAAVLVLVNLLLLGLVIFPRQAPAAPTATPSPTSLPATLPATPTLPDLTPQVESTPTALPLEAAQGLRQQGVIILALSDAGYSHLFAFHPQYLAPTRLTNGPSDDVDPAISPDGTRLAFASRRNGYWDLYLMDIRSGQTTRLTDTPVYDGAPAWSNDGQWLVYQSFVDDNLELFLLSLSNPTQPPLRLTTDPAADYAPAWSPEGRSIAFVSTRSGREDIWLARLDVVDNRFVCVTQPYPNPSTQPAWSPDGKQLAWVETTPSSSQVVAWDTRTPEKPPRVLGAGIKPVWSPTGVVLAAVISPNATAISGYAADDAALRIPPLQLPGSLHGMDWKAAGAGEAILNIRLTDQSRAPIQPLWSAILTAIPAANGRVNVVPLPDVTAPYPYLHDGVDESFNLLRQHVARDAGWDFLANLENAYIPITAPLTPGMTQDWLFTGRAFAANTAPLTAGWITLSREDFNGLTYWRVYLKARYQDGSQGSIITRPVWDTNARYSGSSTAYEQGGVSGPPPAGYWIDFTELALRYNWERLPALDNWRTFYPAARFNTFILSAGLDWRAAMAQVYPAEAIATPTPFVTATSTPTPTATVWYSRYITPSITPTYTLTPTRRPTLTPNP